MIWQDEELKSPFNGEFLKKDAPHSLTDGARRFPVVNDIPYLRANREELCAKVLEKLDAGDEKSALKLLFRDQDDWWRGAPPTDAALDEIFDNENLTIRDAMRVFGYAAVGDYFAFRWSDPTFLSGLSLLENFLPPNVRNVLELCCGIGHYLREFGLRNIAATGADVVFSKLWLARRFVAPEAKLVCFDANYNFPFADDAFDAAFCHDAFYFLPEKNQVAAELKRATKDMILIGHAHNAEAENFSSGAAVSTGEYAKMFGGALFFDDAELTKAAIENRKPKAESIEDLRQTEAVSLVCGEQNASRKIIFTLSPENRRLKINPLFTGESAKVSAAPRFPSERYEKEYAELSGYLRFENELSGAELEKLENGKWSDDTKLKDLARRRIFLDLPEKW